MLYPIVRPTWGSFKEIYSIVITIWRAENDAQLVISPCRGTSPITSAARLYRSFHDLLMERSRVLHQRPDAPAAADPGIINAAGPAVRLTLSTL